MRDLARSFKQVCDHNRDGSHGTQRDRRYMLSLIANQLKELGFRHVKTAHDLKPKHVGKLVEHWKRTEVSVGAIKNRMSALRWLNSKVGDGNLVEATNAHYNIEQRVYVSNEDKSVDFDQGRIEAIPDRFVQASAMLQREFGLRREEAMKIQPGVADKGDRLVLQPSWCKGGRDRELPINTESQREALAVAHKIAGNGSLIPSEKSYVQHLRTFERLMDKVGLSKTHGARHAYAQVRYKELTGRECPSKGGKVSKELDKTEKAQDRQIRLRISREMGHARESVTAVYLGR